MKEGGGARAPFPKQRLVIDLYLIPFFNTCESQVLVSKFQGFNK